MGGKVLLDDAEMAKQILRRRFILLGARSFGRALASRRHSVQGKAPDSVMKSGDYALAFLCMSTVVHVLSPAWQRFSSGQSAHLGLRAMQSLRPCQMI